MNAPIERNAWGYPTGYLPREQAALQDQPLLIELYESEPRIPAWALALVATAMSIALAWVLT